MIPGGGARQKIFCKVNQKAQTIPGWIDEHLENLAENFGVIRHLSRKA